MIITLTYLRSIGACRPSRQWFARRYLESHDCRVPVSVWTRDEQIAVLRDGFRWLGWAFDRGVLPMWSMTGADLTGADLTDAYLTRARWPRASPVPAGWTLGASGCCTECDAVYGVLTRA